MGHVIHHRKINGESRYRVWSTNVDGYLTGELTLEEVREFEVERAIRVAREDAMFNLERRLQRAHGPGGSSGFAVPELAHGWKKEGPLSDDEDG